MCVHKDFRSCAELLFANRIQPQLRDKLRCCPCPAYLEKGGAEKERSSRWECITILQLCSRRTVSRLLGSCKRGRGDPLLSNAGGSSWVRYGQQISIEHHTPTLCKTYRFQASGLFFGILQKRKRWSVALKRGGLVLNARYATNQYWTGN